MKYLPRLLALLWLLPLLATAQLRDDFTDGNFTAGPAWTGDTGGFQVTSQQLQSNGPATTPTQLQLITPCQASTGTVWEFWANLRLATSSGNLADVWLLASQADLKSPATKGYFVRLGGTADEVSLFRKDSARAPVLVIDGQDNTLSSTTNNLVRVRVTRSVSNVWTLERDLTGGRNYLPETGAPVDATHQRSVAVGVLLLYSAANNRSFYFDDFAVTDAVPPLLTRATALSLRQLDVVFNEAVEPGAAATPGNYLVVGGAAPTAAQVSALNPAVVRLTFGADFAPGSNALQVSTMPDLYGNIAPVLTASFAAPLPPAVAPLPGELIISEIMADETPQVGLPLAEYVEIHNRSATKTLSLRGVRLGKTSSSASNASALFADTARLRPGQYAVVCGSTRAVLFAGLGTKVYGLSNFPALNNAGDQLVLRGPGGMVLHEVRYSDAWYRDPAKKDGGWSLEMIDTNTFCGESDNWLASPDPSGGTPGRSNAGRGTNPDQAPPTLLRAELPDPLTLRLTFSEKLDSAAAASPARYALAGAAAPAIVRVAPVGPDFRQVDLTLGAALLPSQRTVVTVQMATDCAGNASGPLQAVSFAEPSSPPAVGELIISEIFADETPVVGLPAAEYVEIYNRSATKTLNLGGVRLTKPSAAGSAIFADTARLRPGQYAVVCATARAALFAGPATKVFGLSGFPALTNGGDALVLRGRDGRTLFEVAYTDGWYQDAKKKDGGWSLEMVDADNYCAGAANWRASTDPSGGTPGRPNAVRAANPDRLPPALLRAVALNATTLRLTFSEKLDSITAASPARYVLAAPGPSVLAAAPVGPAFRQVELTLAAPLSPSRPLTLRVQAATDCAGNVSGALQSVQFALPEAAAPGDVVTNEILFNPRPGAVDFVEILNRSTKFISLQGWQLANEKPDGAADAVPLSPDPLVLAPGELLALTSQALIIQTEYPTSHDPTRLLEIKSLPTFPDDAGTVLLLTGQGQEIDRFAYSKALHLSLLASLDGVSLERIRAGGPSAGSNFHSAAGAVGYATPGRPNSQAQDAVGGNQELTVTPEVFTPDDDGQQDFATLNFHLDQPGYVASVTIYDALGRLTRRLARNETLPTDGFLQWNGLDEGGRKAAVGYYILHVELFRPGGGEKREYKRTVVLGARF